MNNYKSVKDSQLVNSGSGLTVYKACHTAVLLLLWKKIFGLMKCEGLTLNSL